MITLKQIFKPIWDFFFKPKEKKPIIKTVIINNEIRVYSDNELIIKATVYPIRDKQRIEQVTNLLKLLK